MKRSITLAGAGVATLALVAVAPVGASSGQTGTPARAGVGAKVGGFVGPRGFDIGASGKTVIATADGRIYRVVRTGPHTGARHVIARVVHGTGPENVAPAVAVANDNAVWVLTTGGPPKQQGWGTLYLKRKGHRIQAVANISRFVRRHYQDPFDLDQPPNPADSNPYGVAALPDGSALVADAGNNSLMRVWRNGRISAVARVKPRVVTVPKAVHDQVPNLPNRLPAEAVITSVAVGSDGAWYIGELRGFPATPGTSEIWRIKPGTHRGICRPARPHAGPCTRFADGLTSVVALENGPRRTIYAAELSKMTWLALESQPPVPGADIGAVFWVRPGGAKVELAKNQVHLPGAVARDNRGRVYVSGPIFGTGGFMRIR